jgi:peptidyl-prolyl cis-trans isomerase B (cyclophilin B)
MKNLLANLENFVKTIGLRFRQQFPGLLALQFTVCFLITQPIQTAFAAQPGDTAMSHPQVELNTNKGRIVLELNSEKAPKTVANFLSYVKSGHYDGVIFHRVIDNFMVQGGGMDANFKEKPTKDSIENEADNGLTNEEGTVAMARTNAPHSASAQFFINVKNNTFLNHTGKTPQGWGYAVFGKVVEGMDVVNTIKKVKTGNRGHHSDVPVENIVIESAKVISE